MEQYKYRLWAKCVAVLDFIFVVLNLLILAIFLVLSVYLLVKGLANRNNPEDDDPHVNKKEDEDDWLGGGDIHSLATGIALCVGAGIYAILLAFFATAAFKLWKATEIGVDPSVAFSQGKHWRVVCIALTVIAGFSLASSLLILPFVVFSIYRAILFIVVGAYLGELEVAKYARDMGVHCQTSSDAEPTHALEKVRVENNE